MILFICSTWKSDNDELKFLASTKLAKYQEVSGCFHGELWVISVWVMCLREFIFNSINFHLGVVIFCYVSNSDGC